MNSFVRAVLTYDVSIVKRNLPQTYSFDTYVCTYVHMNCSIFLDAKKAFLILFIVTEYPTTGVEEMNA